MESNIDEMSQHMAANMTVDDEEVAAKPNGKTHDYTLKLDLPNSELPEVVHAVLFFISYNVFRFILMLIMNLVKNLR